MYQALGTLTSEEDLLDTTTTPFHGLDNVIHTDGCVLEDDGQEAVPFVDVVTTMSDESIPLTTFEYKEWGNPANKEEYDYIKSYSPYDNIKPSNYPAVLVTSSLYDSQVQYYEPAKYVPKLRENSTSDNQILMKMNLVGGHAVKSGRLNAIE